ncbi:hypothetical protein ACWGJ2_24305 [Streptomyces sp. NPDC054796]
MITLSTGGMVVYFAYDGGFHSVVTDGAEPCAILGGGLFALGRWLRRIRGIELSSGRVDEA